MLDLLHRLFGTHVETPEHTRWERGSFTSDCSHCGREMMRLPGLPWRAGRPG